MKKLQRKKKTCLCGCLLLFGLLAVALGAAYNPGSSGDPLVTKSWVDQYVAKSVVGLENRLDTIEKQLDGELQTIILWVGQNRALVNGQQKTIEAPPVLQNGRTLLPLRFLGDALGATFSWDAVEKKAAFRKNDVKVEVWINQKKMRVDGVMETLDVAPTIQNGRTMAPVRVISDKLGAKVNWDNQTKKVTIIY